IRGIRLHVGYHLKAAAIDHQAAFGSEEFQAASSRAASSACLAKRIIGSESVIFEERILGVGSFAGLLQRKTSAAGGYGLRPVCVHEPLDDIDLVSAEISHLTARVIPKPAEMIKSAHFVVWTIRRGSKPHVVVEIDWRGAIRRRSESGHHVAERSGSCT